MKKCSKCKYDLQDNEKFCSQCGADCETESKQPSFSQKRQQREDETQQILSSAYLKKEQLEGLQKCDESKYVIKFLSSYGSFTKKCGALVFVSLFVFILNFAIGIALKYVELSDNAKLLTIVAIFFASVVSIVIFLEKLYLYRTLNYMKNSEFAIKKTTYAKPPIIKFGNELYEIGTTQNCPFCMQGGAMHFEELEGNFVIVCPRNREHLLIVDTQEIKKMLQKN